MNAATIIGKWFWTAMIGVTLINAAIFRVRARPRIKQDPELEEGYNKIIKGVVFWGNLPWVVMGLGCTMGGVPSVFHYFRPRDGNPFVIAFFVSVLFIWGLCTYWLFACNGAEMIVKHRGLFNYDVKSPRLIKLFWLLCLAGGIAGMLMMIFWDIPVPVQ